MFDIASFRRSNQGQQSGGRMSCVEFFCFFKLFIILLSFSLFFLENCKQVVSQQVVGSIKGMELEFYLISPPPHKLQFL